eukprot:CAMPEP_0119502352 /NCGR_PEP_ID=MMETSP1344-20130328/23850_1 /TAXON_ID=236787 /ORGANISM="Florenciella parvula, Strain CCMP2471" /LENGTH=106 /DNA_ID=CAMNT_0007538553 /DNA_START=46 /DNA_END=367 /DNA_ORIENTATION=+
MARPSALASQAQQRPRLRKCLVDVGKRLERPLLVFVAFWEEGGVPRFDRTPEHPEAELAGNGTGTSTGTGHLSVHHREAWCPVVAADHPQSLVIADVPDQRPKPIL